MNTMKAVVFHGVNDIGIEEVARPRPKAGEAVIRITATTICGTDVHIVKGEYPVRPGLILGHEPVGVIEELGEGLEGEYTAGQRVIVGAITPCGQCFYCLNGAHSQCHGALGGWRFGNTINGAWAEFLLVPDARANLAVVPDELTDEQVLMLPTSRRRASQGPRAATFDSATASRFLRRGRSDCAQRSVRSSGVPD
jgi:threonine dehydrogenase-like Zn-dependent dehydrogenase